MNNSAIEAARRTPLGLADCCCSAVVTGSQSALDRLFKVFAHDDPTDELGSAWGVKEHPRMLLATTDLDATDTARGHLGRAVAAADVDECWKLWNTINAWRDETETFIETRSPTHVPRP